MLIGFTVHKRDLRNERRRFQSFEHPSLRCDHQVVVYTDRDHGDLRPQLFQRHS